WAWSGDEEVDAGICGYTRIYRYTHIPRKIRQARSYRPLVRHLVVDGHIKVGKCREAFEKQPELVRTKVKQLIVGCRWANTRAREKMGNRRGFNGDRPKRHQDGGKSGGLDKL